MRKTGLLTRSAAGGAESAFAASGFREAVAFYPFDGFIPCYDHLGDAIAWMDFEGLSAEVLEDHAYLASIAGIDRGGAVGESDRMLKGQAASGADLRFEAWRELD